MSKKLVLHLPNELKKSVDAGKHNFFNILKSTFSELDFEIESKQIRKFSGNAAKFNNNYHIFHIDGAVGARALNIRKAHFYPFWSFENAGDRHTSRISRLKFDPDEINAIAAQEFFNKICVRNLPAHPPKMAQKNFVFVPLQGRLLKRRSWQYASCRQMIDSVISHDPERQILLKLHPRETYSSAETSLINSLSDHPRVEITNTDTYSLLKHCRYVVTQNSAVAFEGFLYQKPAILYATSSFPHICQTVINPLQAGNAFEKTLTIRPHFEKFVYWYLQLNCINAGREDASAKILQMVQECGWNIFNTHKSG